MSAFVTLARRSAARIFFVPTSTDPDETRRRTILARIVVFLIAGCLALLLDTLLNYPPGQLFSGAFLTDLARIPGALEMFCGSALGLAGLLLIYGLNRQALGRLGWLPGVCLLVTVTGMVAFADTPREVIDGRSLMLWVLPIALAPLILPAWTAFLAATTSAVTIILLALRITYEVNWYSLLGFYAIAFVSWLSANALEGALCAARNEAEKSRVILENIGEGVIVVDGAGEVRVANSTARTLLGNQLVAAARTAPERLEAAGRILAFSWAQINGVGQAAVLRDITRQVEIERAKDALLGTVSHELRTPLAAISGFAEMIGMLSQNDKISEMAGRIVSNVMRLKGLVNSLLDQAQLQAGTLKLTFADLAPLKLAEEVRSLLSGLAEEKGLTFTVQVTSGTPRQVRGDPERLHQILVNMVGNAIKFTDRGGVRLEVFTLPENCWGFSVADTGDGIPVARLPDIFEPFRRGSDYATRPRQGAGLGLSITKQLVEMQGGTISVQSTVGQGTLFSVSLPVGGPR